jgi:bla regulator protein BlaR1
VCVLLINKIIGEERENSCDDLVDDSTKAPVIYAKALFKLEQTRQNELQLALAVTGKKYHLLNRIERIMKTKKQMPSVRPTLVAMLILTIGVSGLALLNPEIAQGKISVKAITPEVIKELVTPDTIPAKKAVKAKRTAEKAVTKSQAATTTKVKAEIAAARAKNRSAFNYNYGNYSYHVGMDDPQLEKLSKEVERHGDAIGKYYDSPEFKAKSEEMDKLGKQIDAFYNSPEIKQATADQEKAAKEYENLWSGRSGKIDEISKQMSAAGDVMSKYYESTEFKDMHAKIAKKYGIPVDGVFNSNDVKNDDNYRQYQAEVKKNIPQNVLQQQDKMKDLGKQMRDYTSSPDIKKSQEAMRITGESMRKAYHNPDIKATQERMRKIGQEMRDYTANPDMKREKEELRAASEKLRAYTKSPEFKKKVAEYRKTHPDEAWNWNNNNDDTKADIEKPQAPDKPEAPEKSESN